MSEQPADTPSPDPATEVDRCDGVWLLIHQLWTWWIVWLLVMWFLPDAVAYLLMAAGFSGLFGSLSWAIVVLPEVVILVYILRCTPKRTKLRRLMVFLGCLLVAALAMNAIPVWLRGLVGYDLHPARVYQRRHDRDASQTRPRDFVNALGMRFVWIEPGKFTMGSPEDEMGASSWETPHEVTLTRGFWMQTTEVTQKQWVAVMKENPSFFRGDNLPVEHVSWHDAQAFLDRLNAMEPNSLERSAELKYRLPTEAEWEYACRAGTTTAFNTGDTLRLTDANCINEGQDRLALGSERGMTAAVASYRPNAWGLYDMHGNVREWCADWFSKLPSEPATDPKGPDTKDPEVGERRVVRGGHCLGALRYCRSGSRTASDDPSRRVSAIGFRVVAEGRGLRAGAPAPATTGTSR